MICPLFEKIQIKNDEEVLRTPGVYFKICFTSTGCFEEGCNAKVSFLFNCQYDTLSGTPCRGETDMFTGLMGI